MYKSANMAVTLTHQQSAWWCMCWHHKQSEKFHTAEEMQSSTLQGGDTHHNIHRLSSIFVLNNHGVSARVIQRNTFDGQAGESALVQRHHVLEHERSDVSEALHSKLLRDLTFNSPPYLLFTLPFDAILDPIFFPVSLISAGSSEFK